MARYIKKFSRVGSLGPTEERGFALWVGYDIEGTDIDLTSAGLVKVEGWNGEELARHRVTSFTRVALTDVALRGRLGLPLQDEE
jgi:hypothetical protein